MKSRMMKYRMIHQISIILFSARIIGMSIRGVCLAPSQPPYYPSVGKAGKGGKDGKFGSHNPSLWRKNSIAPTRAKSFSPVIITSIVKDAKRSTNPKESLTHRPSAAPSMHFSSPPEGMFSPAPAPSVPTSNHQDAPALGSELSSPSPNTNPTDFLSREQSKKPTLSPSHSSYRPSILETTLSNAPLNTIMVPSSIDRITGEPSKSSPSTYGSETNNPTRSYFSEDHEPVSSVYPIHAPEQPTYQPTITKMPSINPVDTQPSCYPFDPSNNIYGKRSQHPIILFFNYEMIYKRAFSVYSSILPALELNLTHTLFDSTLLFGCANDTTEIENASGVMGVSRSPPDVVMNRRCEVDLEAETELDDDGNTCRFVEGRMLYYMSPGSTTQMKDEVVNDTLRVIESTMSNGDLAQSHEGIIKLIFVKISDEGQNETDPETSIASEGPKTTNTNTTLPVSTLTWILVASSGTLILFVIIAGHRCCKRRDAGLSYGELICGSDYGSTFDEHSE